MSGVLLKSTMTIMESTMTFPVLLHSGKLKQDKPRGMAESEALKLFKAEVQNVICLSETEDYFLLRFLRARALHIEKSKDMLEKYVEYYKDNTYMIDLRQESFFPSKFILDQIKFLKSGNDYDGRPVMFLQIGQTDLRRIFDSGYFEDVQRFVHYILEYCVYVSESHRKIYGSTKVVVVIDLDGFSFRNAFHTQTVQTAVYVARVLEAFYPELLHLGIGINVNWIFNSLYNLMKPFLHADTIEKVQLYGSEPQKWQPILKKYIQENSIPPEYGGTSTTSLKDAGCDVFQGFRVTSF